MTIHEIIALIDSYNLSEAFAALDSLGVQDSFYARLKKEFISGVAKTDVDFVGRLKTFVRSLENTPQVIPTSGGSPHPIIKEKIMINKDQLFEQIDNNELDAVFETLGKNKDIFKGFQDLRDRFIYDNPKGLDLQKFKQGLKVFIDSKLEND